MRDIHCGSTTNGKGHFLARINGGKLELWCAKCKTWHTLDVTEIVSMALADTKDTQPVDGKRLLW